MKIKVFTRAQRFLANVFCLRIFVFYVILLEPIERILPDVSFSEKAGDAIRFWREKIGFPHR